MSSRAAALGDAWLASAGQTSSVPQAIAILPFLALWLWCLVDVVQTDDRLVRGLSKQQWMFMVLLTNFVGGLLWLAFGRPRRAGR